MNRRDFIKKGAIRATIPFWLQYCGTPGTNYPVHLHSDHHVGHLLFKSSEWPVVKKNPIEVAVVGGGIAGLTAAYGVKDKDYQLFELSHKLGGSVATETFQNISFSQGAHYDLAYPQSYGEEVLKLLESLDVIVYESWKKSWSFKDESHIIPYSRRQQCYENGSLRKDVIPESPLKSQFVQLMQQYKGEMMLPTRLIRDEFQDLNNLTFEQFLQQSLPLTPALKRQLDYHMFDDYGGSTSQVSALAGIHYFMCRPYYDESVDLFSPPNGNDYFAQKITSQLSSDRLNRGHLVRNIEKRSDHHLIRIADIENKQVIEFEAEKVIYAGQKHALKYITPDQGSLFPNNYAPWMVVNLITHQPPGDYGYWQNEYLGKNPNFLGFIDSSVQDQGVLNGYRVFTGYYCLDEKDRNYLTTVDEVKEHIAKETQEYVENMLGHSIRVEAAYIKVMGHAMPIPKPGYLFRDANDAPAASMIYAGVDNGRLPLLYEALDSGLMAASLI